MELVKKLEWKGFEGGGDKGSNPQARLETRLEIFDLVYFLQIYTCLILLYIYGKSWRIRFVSKLE